MIIGEIKDYLDEGECVAISCDTVGCGAARFHRSTIYSKFNNSLLWKDKTLGTVIWHGPYPYWITHEDCKRLIQIMDAYQEPKPEAKFKLGQWVRCTYPSHPPDHNPYCIGGIHSGITTFNYGWDEEHNMQCDEDTLVAVEPPKPERKPAFEPGTCVEYPPTGVKHRLLRFIRFWESEDEEWEAFGLDSRSYFHWHGTPSKWRIIPDPDKPLHWAKIRSGEILTYKDKALQGALLELLGRVKKLEKKNV